jgi:hypothetical protein
MVPAPSGAAGAKSFPAFAGAGGSMPEKNFYEEDYRDGLAAENLLRETPMDEWLKGVS